MTTIDDRISSSDLTLFDHVESQTTAADRLSLLALQAACRERHAEYVYLEIGSYLGGSLQPYVIDPRCKLIISIDPRPQASPDERGYPSGYSGNSTEGMLRNLAGIPGAQLEKVHTIEASTSEVSPEEIPARPNLCFSDAEHTDDAALRDARFCLSVMDGEGCIAFHDSQILYKALNAFVRELEESGIDFQPYVLPLAIFAIELGEPDLLHSTHIRKALLNSYSAYLWALNSNDRHWARVKNRLAEQLARRAEAEARRAGAEARD